MSHYDIEIIHGIIAVVVVAIILIIVAIRLFIKAHKQYEEKRKFIAESKNLTLLRVMSKNHHH